MDAVTMYREASCDSFVSIGGGSSLDACKGARVSVAHDGRNVNEFGGFNKSENPKNPPHIAVSTTAGTGSETSWAYVITDTTTDPADLTGNGLDVGQAKCQAQVRRRTLHCRSGPAWAGLAGCGTAKRRDAQAYKPSRRAL